MQNVESVASIVNKIANEFKKREMVVQIWNTVTNWPNGFVLIAPTRFYIKEIECFTISKENGNIKCKIYLFNNLVLFTKKSGKKYINHVKLNILPWPRIQDLKKEEVGSLKSMIVNYLFLPQLQVFLKIVASKYLIEEVNENILIVTISASILKIF